MSHEPIITLFYHAPGRQVVVSVNGQNKSVYPCDHEPSEEELAAFKAQATEDLSAYLHSLKKKKPLTTQTASQLALERGILTEQPSLPAKPTQRQGMIEISKDCERAYLEKTGEVFKLFLTPERIIQWQKSFATMRTELRFKGSPDYKATCYVRTQRVMGTEQVPAHLLIIPRSPE